MQFAIKIKNADLYLTKGQMLTPIIEDAILCNSFNEAKVIVRSQTLPNDFSIARVISYGE